MKKTILSLAMILTVAGILNAQSKFKTRQDSLEFEAAKTEVWSPVPKTVQPGNSFADAPSDAIVLYNGKNLDAFQKRKGGVPGWKIEEDGALTVVKGSGDLETKEAFGDCQFHLEFREPSVIAGSNQTRGNSGIWFMSNYEMQILDNYNNPTYVNGMVGSLYKQHVPLVAAGRKPGEWQTYDILFTAPQFKDNGELATPARITAFLNGVLVQNNVIVYGPVEWIGLPKYVKHASKMPIYLQDHGFDGGQPVSFRNIWIRPL
jgi:Domain of Unknown Function (DUF1080)